MSKPSRIHRARLVLLLWVLVTIFYFYASRDYISAEISDRKFVNYLGYIVQRTGAESRPAREIREFLMIKADELGLPIRGDQITIRGLGASLDIAVAYDQDVNVPIFNHGVYRKLYKHRVQYKVPR